MPDVTNRAKSNSVELNRTQSRDWVRLSSVIERNRTLTKIEQSNVWMSSIGHDQVRLGAILKMDELEDGFD